MMGSRVLLSEIKLRRMISSNKSFSSILLKLKDIEETDRTIGSILDLLSLGTAISTDFSTD